MAPILSPKMRKKEPKKGKNIAILQDTKRDFLSEKKIRKIGYLDEK